MKISQKPKSWYPNKYKTKVLTRLGLFIHEHSSNVPNQMLFFHQQMSKN